MSPPHNPVYLSKSLYMRGLQCRKSLYLDRYHPELRTEPTAALEALWRSGHEVGDYAHRLFPGGVIVPFEGLTKEDQLARTRAEIDRGAKVIYEAAFSFNDVFVKADIIVRDLPRPHRQQLRPQGGDRPASAVLHRGHHRGGAGEAGVDPGHAVGHAGHAAREGARH